MKNPMSMVPKVSSSAAQEMVLPLGKEDIRIRAGLSKIFGFVDAKVSKRISVFDQNTDGMIPHFGPVLYVETLSHLVQNILKSDSQSFECAQIGSELSMSRGKTIKWQCPSTHHVFLGPVNQLGGLIPVDLIIPAG